MKKILIFYGAYGGGHLSAARSIKNYLEANYKDCEILMLDCVEYINKYLNKISTTAYKEMAKKAPWIWKKVYNNSEHGALAKISTTSNKLMSRKLNTILQEFSPDLVISTHPFSNQMCTNLKKNKKIKCKIATVLTDMAPHSQWIINSEYIDYFFVSNREMREALSDSGIADFKIFVTGIPLSEKFKYTFDLDSIYNDFELDKNKTTVLFFAGGEFGLGRKRTSLVFRALIRLCKNYQIVAISGKNKKMYLKFKNLVDSYGVSDRVKVLEFTDKVPELMAISNFVITKPGGLTTSEALVSGDPLILINPIPGQEEENAEFLVRNNVAIWIKKEDNIARILKNIYRHPEKIEEMKKNIPNLAKPNSTKNICDILMDTI
ncbi:MAG: glycosyltransferase [Clostridia bacterium]|nr:glycosyltransferase [Clostridia bacterium]